LFIIAWAWVGVDHSDIKRDENKLIEVHKPGVDEIVLSRSHAGHAHEILKKIYHDKQYKIIPAAGSAYKTIHILEEYADYYLHITPIKKWDLCAPDAILRANYGTMTTLKNRTINCDHQNKDFLIKDGILATYKKNHNDLLKFLVDSNLTKYLNEKKS
jgi:inositol monophosphatase 3